MTPEKDKDVVERLREYVNPDGQPVYPHGCIRARNLILEAADEIERLRSSPACAPELAQRVIDHFESPDRIRLYGQPLSNETSLVTTAKEVLAACVSERERTIEECAKVAEDLKHLPDAELISLDPNPSHQRAGAVARRNACEAIASAIRSLGPARGTE